MLFIKRTFIIPLIFITANVFGQQNLNFKISGLKDTTVFLARILGRNFIMLIPHILKMKQSFLIKKSLQEVFMQWSVQTLNTLNLLLQMKM